MKSNKIIIFQLQEKIGLIRKALKEKTIKDFTLESNSLSNEHSEQQWLYRGHIIEFVGTSLIIKITDDIEILLSNYKHYNYNLKFHTNRINIQMQHQALNWLYDHDVFHFLLDPKFFKHYLPSSDSNANEFKFSCKMTKNLNNEQQLAVKLIVQAKNQPFPFILFGPPGTGKTRTIAAAIAEIIVSTEKFVLVCASSNAACDEIGERLLDILDADRIFRMYAKTYDRNTLSEKMKRICNLKNGTFQFPQLKYLYQFRVVICTLTTAGFLTMARGADSNFNSSHFSYIFIDEAACVQETICLIPITGNYIDLH